MVRVADAQDFLVGNGEDGLREEDAEEGLSGAWENSERDVEGGAWGVLVLNSLDECFMPEKMSGISKTSCRYFPNRIKWLS